MIGCYNNSNVRCDGRDDEVNDIELSEKLTIAALVVSPIGLFLLADSSVLLRCYGDQQGAVTEFIVGVLAVTASTVLMYVACMLRDRRIQAEFARRREAREKRRAEREERMR